MTYELQPDGLCDEHEQAGVGGDSEDGHQDIYGAPGADRVRGGCNGPAVPEWELI